MKKCFTSIELLAVIVILVVIALIAISIIINIIKDTYDTLEETRQLYYYKNIVVTTNNYSRAIKKYNVSVKYWWLHSTISNGTFSFSGMNYYGSCGIGGVGNTQGMTLSF